MEGLVSKKKVDPQQFRKRVYVREMLVIKDVLSCCPNGSILKILLPGVKFTPMSIGEFPDLCLKTALLFLLTMQPIQPP
jgi:hypothetical protein